MSSDTRGELSYQAVMPEGNIYRLRVAFDQFFPEAREVKLNAYWDETFIGGITLDMGAESAELTAIHAMDSGGGAFLATRLGRPSPRSGSPHRRY